MPQTLLLQQGDDTLGVLEVVGPDMPWLDCHFTPTQAFETVRELFETELALLDGDAMDVWEEAYRRIDALGLSLMDKGTGQPVGEFLLHIRGNGAWLRYRSWRDEP